MQKIKLLISHSIEFLKYEFKFFLKSKLKFLDVMPKKTKMLYERYEIKYDLKKSISVFVSNI